MNQNINEVEINGVKYIRSDVLPTGNRHVVVVDRGWIFAGDLTEKDGRIRLSRAVHVQGWDSVGFDGMIKEPKSPKVRLRKLDNIVDFPADAELFRVPVSETWGL